VAAVDVLEGALVSQAFVGAFAVGESSLGDSGDGFGGFLFDFLEAGY
jgi:hypothetical protein